MSWLDRMQTRFEETGRDTSLLLQETSWFMENQVNVVGNNVRKLCSESSWFVENQVNTVSNSVRKLCSEFVRELLTPIGPPSPCSSQDEESPVMASPVTAEQSAWNRSNINSVNREKKSSTTQTTLPSSIIQSDLGVETVAVISQGEAVKEWDERVQATKSLRRRHSKGLTDKEDNSEGGYAVPGRSKCPASRSSSVEKVEWLEGREEKEKGAAETFGEHQSERRVKDGAKEVAVLLLEDLVRKVAVEPQAALSPESLESAALTTVEECSPGYSDAVEELPVDTNEMGLTGKSPEMLLVLGNTETLGATKNPDDKCHQEEGSLKIVRSETELDLELLSESECDVGQGQWYAVSDTESVDRKRKEIGRSASAVSLESRRNETGNDFTDWELV